MLKGLVREKGTRRERGWKSGFSFCRGVLLVLFCQHTHTLSLGALRRTRHFQSTSKVKFQQFIVVLLDCGNLCVVVNSQPKEALAWPDSCLRQECQRLEFDSNTHTHRVFERNGTEEKKTGLLQFLRFQKFMTLIQHSMRIFKEAAKQRQAYCWARKKLCYPLSFAFQQLFRLINQMKSIVP